ncbi:MAG: hypothetical protein ABR572_07955 [Cryomorphaceae bacterium]
MKVFKSRILAVVAALVLLPSACVLAQDGSALPTDKDQKEDESIVRFNGLGRTLLQDTKLGGDVLDTDTTSARRLTDGEFLLDLQINASPNDKTEVQSILRLRNEFGGFFGAGMSVEVRELWAAGVIADALKYHVGDMDLAMTPYTFYNFDEEGSVNLPEAFKPQRDVIHYEQFYGDGNTRRMQGAKLDLGLGFTRILKDADFNAFISRIRGTDFFTLPSRFTTGGQANFSTRTIDEDLGMTADFGFNFVHTFDDRRMGEVTRGIRNTVSSFNWNLQIFRNDEYALSFLGETGMSSIEEKDDSLSYFSRDAVFLEAGLKFELREPKVTVRGSFVDVGPDYFSMAAQSRRIDLRNEKAFYDRLGADQNIRPLSLFDITRDRAIYTFELNDVLMPYDPRFTNTMPYGIATPNRRGARFSAEQGNDSDPVNARLDGALMSEIRGQGTEELKDFLLLRASANVNIHDYLDWERKQRFTLGYQYESTQRGGVEVEQVDLVSNLVELGFESELFQGFDVLLGVKFLQAQGNEFLPRIDQFNEVIDFNRTNNGVDFDDQEQLYAGGFRYTFKEGVYLTLQYHAFNSRKGDNNPNDFNLNQFFVLYNMYF